MPIRFACPHCRQKLSVTSRKAGTTGECPRCKRSLQIPVPPREPARPAQADAPQPSPQPSPKPKPAEPKPFTSEPPPGPPAETPAAESLPEPAAAPAATAVIDEPVAGAPLPVAAAPETFFDEDAIFTPDTAEFDGLELVYDSPDPARAALPASADLVAIPRYVIYLQGGLLGLVALLAFAIGTLTGGAILTQPRQPDPPQACTIRGSVMYAAGTRALPDDGAVIVIVPQTGEKPDEKAPVQGLRPGDPSPGEDHRGIAILRAAGGNYARVDANGRFELKLPDRGRYLVLAISNQRLLASVEEIKTADILKIGPFFDSAADLLGNHQYKIAQENFRGDRELSLTFE